MRLINDLSNSVDSLLDHAALPDTAFATFSTQFRIAVTGWNDALTVLYGKSGHPATTIPMSYHGL